MTRVKYSKELLEKAIEGCNSIAAVCRNLGLKPVGGNYRTVKEKLIKFNIDISHFTGQLWSKGKTLVEATSKFPLEEILKENVNYHSDSLRVRLINAGLKENKCEICGYTENLELHHINGDHFDNRLENLQILCPNCHAKTDNYRGRNSHKNSTPENLTKKFAKSHYCTCMNCGEEFYSDRIDKTRKFCSRKCYVEYLKKLKLGEATEKLQEFSNTSTKSIPKLTKEEVLKEIPNHNNITSLGNAFAVSRTTMRKYLIEYDLYEEFKLKFDFRAKKVKQLDIEGNLIKIWPSVTDAENTLKINDVDKVANGKRRSAGGYIWRYIEE